MQFLELDDGVLG